MSHPNSLSIEIVTASALNARVRSEILSVCSRAYEEDFEPELQLLCGAVHILARLDGVLVSHAAWVERNLYVAEVDCLSCAYIEAVATSPDHQLKGYASAVLKAIPELVREYDIAALSPSEPEFYQRLGWVLWEGSLAYIENEVHVSTPEEQVMIYRLPKTPKDLNLQAQLMTDWRPGDVW